MTADALSPARRSGPEPPGAARPRQGAPPRVLVYAHRLEVGGTQVNAIELAAGLRDRHGFDICLYATPGPMADLVVAKGLRFVPAPDVRYHPSLARMRGLRALVAQEKPDLIHAWDWWQALDAYCGVHLPRRVPVLVSDMMMCLTRVLPHQLPTTFGVPMLQEAARRQGWRDAGLLLPPVDTLANAPGAADGAAFRAALDIAPDELMLVTVSRLAEVLKLDSLRRSIAMMTSLGQRLPLRLVVVGDGQARPQLAAMAAAVNDHLGRRAVDLTGALLDPRPAYAAADVVIGMGGSALRGMAFGKPVIVVGGKGFARLFGPESAADFYATGFYGEGDGQPGTAALSAAIEELAADATWRAQLGQFSRAFVLRHHALPVVVDQLAQSCRAAIAAPAGRRATWLDAVGTGYVYLRERRFRTASRDPLPTGTASAR